MFTSFGQSEINYAALLTQLPLIDKAKYGLHKTCYKTLSHKVKIPRLKERHGKSLPENDVNYLI